MLLSTLGILFHMFFKSVITVKISKKLLDAFSIRHIYDAYKFNHFKGVVLTFLFLFYFFTSL